MIINDSPLGHYSQMVCQIGIHSKNVKWFFKFFTHIVDYMSESWHHQYFLHRANFLQEVKKNWDILPLPFHADSIVLWTVLHMNTTRIYWSIISPNIIIFYLMYFLLEHISFGQLVTMPNVLRSPCCTCVKCQFLLSVKFTVQSNISPMCGPDSFFSM